MHRFDYAAFVSGRVEAGCCLDFVLVKSPRSARNAESQTWAL
jgi:hypothetical protein